MPEVVTTIYLVFMFLALYFFFLFILIVIRNRYRIFYYPEPNKLYGVSLLIAAYNEEKTIKDTIEHVINSDYKGLDNFFGGLKSALQHNTFIRSNMVSIRLLS